jgi:putative sigma-54 modulation protein
MMKIRVKSMHFHVDNKLVDYIEKKLNRLDRFFDRVVDAEVILKLQDTGSKVREKIVEIHIQVPGGVLLDKKVGRTFEAAVDVSVESIKRRLVKFKEKSSVQKGWEFPLEE